MSKLVLVFPFPLAVSRLGVGKRLGGYTARTAEPN